MRISVVGTGYVGLVGAVGFAENGHEVVCVDIDAAKVDAINAGQSPIHEEGLDDLLRSNICLLYTSPSPRDLSTSRMPSSA